MAFGRDNLSPCQVSIPEQFPFCDVHVLKNDQTNINILKSDEECIDLFLKIKMEKIKILFMASCLLLFRTEVNTEYILALYWEPIYSGGVHGSSQNVQK